MYLEADKIISKPAFHRLMVREVRRETADAVSVAFDVPASLRDAFAFKPGQYLTLRAVLGEEDIRRNYSICASPLDGELRIAVKQLRGGRFSTFVNEALRAGDTLEVLPALGHFTENFEAGEGKFYAAFAAGSGITPVLSLMETALRTGDGHRFALFYGNRTSRDILFLERLAALKNRFVNRLEVYHFLSAEQDDFELFNGRLDGSKCREILGTLLNAAAVDRFFLCGPEGMMLSVEESLRAAGVEREKIMLERFAGASPSPARRASNAQTIREAAGRPMSVILDGRKSLVKFDAQLGNILDSARAAGLPAPFACKGGVCTTCRAKTLAGEVEMKLNYGLTADEVAQGYILTCQSTPKTDGVVISYDV